MPVKTITITAPLAANNPNNLNAGKYTVTGTSTNLQSNPHATVYLLQQGQADQSFGPCDIQANGTWQQEITAVANPDPAPTYTIHAVAAGLNPPSDFKTGIRFQ